MGIHTLIVVIKILIEIFSNAADSSDNGIVKLIACLARCFIGCVESAIEWLNTCAYAMTAIGGHTYCDGAWGGFMLYLKHLVKFYFASYIASGFILIGMLGVVAANMGLCWLMLTQVFATSGAMTSIWSPIILIGVVTFIIVGVFLGSFD